MDEPRQRNCRRGSYPPLIGDARVFLQQMSGVLPLAGVYRDKAFGDWRRAIAGGHALFAEFDTSGLIAGEHFGQGVAKFALEIEHLPVIRAELFPQSCPGDKGGFSDVDSMQALGQPGIDIEPHSCLRQGRQVALV